MLEDAIYNLAISCYIDYMKIYAKKDGTLLTDHLIKTAKAMEYLWDKFLCQKWKKICPLDLCIYVARHHDIGKATAEFQQICPDTEYPLPRDPIYSTDYRGNHALYGAIVMHNANIPKDLCEVIAMHHGYTKTTQLSDRLLKKHGNAIGDIAITEGFIDRNLPKKTVLSTTQKTVLVGLLSLADWMASSDQSFPRLTQWIPKQNTFYENFGFHPRPDQQEVIDKIVSNPNDIHIYEATMGSGKTEVALQCAQEIARVTGHNGVVFALPTRATTNAMYKRVLSWVRKQEQPLSVYLANGDKRLVKDFTTLKFDTKDMIHRESFFERPQTELCSTIVCTTIDHIIKSAYRHKYTTIEQFALANKVVIIDEVHSYDAYMMEYLKRELAWLGALGVPVILLSATLPKSTKEALLSAYTQGKEIRTRSTDYPVLTTSKEEFPVKSAQKEKQMKFETVPTLKQGYKKVLEHLRKGYCVGIIVNNVKKAQEIYREFYDYNPILLHSQFTNQDRRVKEEWIEENLGKKGTEETRRGRLFIATQVAEMSLDFDVDFLLTEIAPIDKILQRIGRVHRHNFTDLPLCICVSLEKRRQFRFYPEVLLDNSIRILTQKDHVTLPNDIPSWIEAGYEGYIEDKELIDEATKNLLGKPEPERKSRHTSHFLSLFTERSNEYKVRSGDIVEATLLDEKGVDLGTLSLPYKIAKTNFVKNANDELYLRMDYDKVIHIEGQRWVYDTEVGLNEEV